MFVKAGLYAVLLLLVADAAVAQRIRLAQQSSDRYRDRLVEEPAADESPEPGWRSSDRDAASEADSGPAAAKSPVARKKTPAPIASGDEQLTPVKKDPAASAPIKPRRVSVKSTNGKGTLPTDAGQVWREYDLSPYTLRVTSTNRPEQGVVDWILRETGYEAWHSEPLGLLSANNRTLTVYHTPQMQTVVAEVVERFLDSEAESHAFGLHVITIDNPNWRARAQRMMQPVTVQTQGVQAWLLESEDAAVLLAELRKRSDYREHSSPHVLVHNGQSKVIAATRARSYVRDVALRPANWTGFEAEVGQIDEGFSLEMSPLLSINGDSIDAILKCNIDQVEKLRPVMLDAPTAAAPRQRTKIEVPQISQFRFHERFRWPANKMLLIGLGVVAAPVPVDPNPLTAALPGGAAPARADLLVFIESKGKAGQVPTITRAAGREARSYHGRY